MLDVIRLYLFAFGAVTIVGGVMGFVNARSRASLIAGGVSGVLLLIAGYLVSVASIQTGLILGILVSLALAGRFIPSFMRTRKLMPAGLIAAMSLGAIVLTALGLVQK